MNSKKLKSLKTNNNSDLEEDYQNANENFDHLLPKINNNISNLKKNNLEMSSNKNFLSNGYEKSNKDIKNNRFLNCNKFSTIDSPEDCHNLNNHNRHSHNSDTKISKTSYFETNEFERRNSESDLNSLKINGYIRRTASESSSSSKKENKNFKCFAGAKCNSTSISDLENFDEQSSSASLESKILNSNNKSSDRASSLSSNDEPLTYDDGYVYTYRGGKKEDDLADLPDCFFLNVDDNRLGSNNFQSNNLRNDNYLIDGFQNGNELDYNERNNQLSPDEMDYLEMDFDPGPSGDANDLDRLSNCSDLDLKSLTDDNAQTIDSDIRINNHFDDVQPSTSSGITHSKNDVYLHKFKDVYNSSDEDDDMQITHKRNNNGIYESKLPKIAQTFHRDITLDEFNSFQIINSDDMYKRHIFYKQVASNVNAILNTLVLLNLPVAELQAVLDRLKEYKFKKFSFKNIEKRSLVVNYLIEEFKLYSSHEEILQILKIYGLFARFFATYPKRKLHLSKWLVYWLKLNVLPIVTIMNRDTKKTREKWWQTRVVYGVNDKGEIFLTNPLEIITENDLLDQLCKKSIVQIQKEDILRVWNEKDDLSVLLGVQDSKWIEMNILGKVINTIRESHNAPNRISLEPIIELPIASHTGITLVCTMNNSCIDLLSSCPEFEIFEQLT